ncbi:MAG: phage protease [Verrucomicrobiota bacterium]|jgi:hypothetical protein
MNENHIPLLLENDAAMLDEEGWALIAPFGEHPKTRLVKKNGAIHEEKFIQVLDNESADQLLSRENSLFRRIRRAVVGIPVYKGHPDLRDYAPETVGAAVSREIIGAIDRVRKSGRGLEAHFVLTPDGADAVEKEGHKYPSALWYVQPVGRRGEAVLARPFKLLSAGLTRHPNISGVESLANAKGAGIETEKEPDMKLIAGWLLAQGAVLANADSPTETQVLEALQKLHTSKAGEVSALGNEKSTLTGQITALTNEKAALTAKVTTLENEGVNLKSQISDLKSSRAAAVVDLAIARGKLTVAERSARIEALHNAGDFEASASALLASATRFKTMGSAESGKMLSNQGAGGDPREEYCAAVEQHMKETGATDPIKAHHAVMKKNPSLADKLKVRGQL